MTESKKPLQVIYNLCLFYWGNLLTSLFLRNFIGELAFIVGVVIIMVALFRLSRIQGYGLVGGSICLAIAFLLSLWKVPENMALYSMMECSDKEYVRRASEFLIRMQKWQMAEQIIVASSLVLKLTGCILWMRNKVFAEVKKMFYFLFADLLIGILALSIRSFECGSNAVIYLSFLYYIAHALAMMALGVMVYRLGKGVGVLWKDRKYYAFVFCFSIGCCYLPFLFVGYMTYQIFLLAVCIVFLYGIKIWSSINKQRNVFYWWLCVGGLMVGIIGFPIYGAFVAAPPQFFYCVFVICGMLAAGYGMMARGERDRRVFWGLGALSVLLIPLTFFYSGQMTFFTIAWIWAWVWLPLWMWCLNVWVKKYFHFVEEKSEEVAGNISNRK